LRKLIVVLAAAAMAVAWTRAAAMSYDRLAEILGVPQRSAEADAYSAFLIARYATLTNDPQRALESYSDALQAQPENGELAERAVFAALLAGDFQRATEYASAAEDAKSDLSPHVRMTLAVDAIERGRRTRAEPYLAGRFGPFNTLMVTNLRAWLAMEAGDVDEARAVLTASQVGDETLDSVSLYMLGLIYLSAEEDRKALETFETVWAAGPRLAVAAEAQARLLVQNGRQYEALQLLTDFRQQVGPHPSIDRLRLQIAAGRNVDVVRPDLKQGAALALYAPAAALAAQTDSDLAGVYFAMALALDPQLDAARTLWADTLDRAGRRDEAILLLDDVPETSPFYATARGQMAWTFRRQGRNDRAIATAATALDAQPDRDLRIQLADLFTTLDRDGEADRLLTEIIKEDLSRGQQDWRLLFARGAARERLGRWPEAEIDLRAALVLAPDNPRVLNHLGYGLVDRGHDLEEGLRLISRAANLDPRSGHILDSLGWAYFQLGDYERAILQLERAVEIEPGNATINDHLGDAYWRVGRLIEARFQWQRAISLGLSGQELTEAEIKLERGLPYPSKSLVEYHDLAVHP